MSKFIIKGGQPLKGTVRVGGSKNAALPIMCAGLLCQEKVVLKNVPEISDVESMRKIFHTLNVKTRWLEKNTLEIDPTEVAFAPISHSLVSRMRASILLLGPLLARFGKVRLAFPGGCVLGKRSLFAHIESLEQMKATVGRSHDDLILKGRLKAGMVVMPEMSVTATENVIMAAVLTKGKTHIHLAACEPHVQDLCRFLNSRGARIDGVGSHCLIVDGVKKLSGGEYEVISDYLEAGTLALAAVLTRGEVTIKNIHRHDLDFFFYKLKEAGGRFSFTKGTGTQGQNLIIKPAKRLYAVDVKTAVHPGFPTDLQAPFAVLLTQAEGLSEIFETLFEDRLNYLFELEKMGAKFAFINAHQAKVFGRIRLIGASIASCDIRAGAAMVIAALVAEGETEISNILYIDRGYENLEKKLRELGADIRRMK